MNYFIEIKTDQLRRKETKTQRIINQLDFSTLFLIIFFSLKTLSIKTINYFVPTMKQTIERERSFDFIKNFGTSFILTHNNKIIYVTFRK